MKKKYIKKNSYLYVFWIFFFIESCNNNDKNMNRSKTINICKSQNSHNLKNITLFKYENKNTRWYLPKEINTKDYEIMNIWKNHIVKLFIEQLNICKYDPYLIGLIEKYVDICVIYKECILCYNELTFVYAKKTNYFSVIENINKVFKEFVDKGEIKFLEINYQAMTDERNYDVAFFHKSIMYSKEMENFCIEKLKKERMRKMIFVKYMVEKLGIKRGYSTYMYEFVKKAN